MTSYEERKESFTPLVTQLYISNLIKYMDFVVTHKSIEYSADRERLRKIERRVEELLLDIE